jgi:hypothetical protein
MTVDTIDKHMKLWKTTALECLEYYCSGIIECLEGRRAWISWYVREHRLYALTVT